MCAIVCACTSNGVTVEAPSTASAPAKSEPILDVASESPTIATEFTASSGEQWLASGDYAGCAEAFLERVESEPGREGVELGLWNAARCLEADGRVGEAIEQQRALIEGFPDSPLSLDALEAMAEAHLELAMFEAAAGLFEVFVARAPADPRAPEVLARAHQLRVDLRQREAADADRARFERDYAKGDPAAFAALAWSTRALLESEDARLSHARAYLDAHRQAGGPERELLAEFVLAEADWVASCPVETQAGLCVTKRGLQAPRGLEARGQGRRYRPPTYCPDWSRAPQLVAEERAFRSSARAVAGFERVVELGASLDADGGARVFAGEVAGAHAMAIAHLADGEFEAQLELSPPDELSFLTEAWRKDSGVPVWERKYADQVRTAASARAELQAFLDASQRRFDASAERYERAAALGGAPLRLLADAREAAAAEALAGALTWARVPRGSESEEDTQAFCDAFGAAADGLVDEARGAYEACTAHSLEAQYDDAVSRTCAAALRSYAGIGALEFGAGEFAPRSGESSVSVTPVQPG